MENYLNELKQLLNDSRNTKEKKKQELEMISKTYYDLISSLDWKCMDLCQRINELEGK